jgi:hypothetical protein
MLNCFHVLTKIILIYHENMWKYFWKKSNEYKVLGDFVTSALK